MTHRTTDILATAAVVALAFGLAACIATGLDGLRELALVLGGEQGHLADVVQVQTNGVIHDALFNIPVSSCVPGRTVAQGTYGGERGGRSSFGGMETVTDGWYRALAPIPTFARIVPTPPPTLEKCLPTARLDRRPCVSVCWGARSTRPIWVIWPPPGPSGRNRTLAA